MKVGLKDNNNYIFGYKAMSSIISQKMEVFMTFCENLISPKYYLCNVIVLCHETSLCEDRMLWGSLCFLYVALDSVLRDSCQHTMNNNYDRTKGKVLSLPGKTFKTAIQKILKPGKP